MHVGIFIKDFLTRMICFAIRSRKITAKWYLKNQEKKKKHDKIHQHKKRSVWPALCLTRQKNTFMRGSDTALMAAGSPHTHCLWCDPEYRINRLCFHYVTDVVRIKQWSPFLYGAKVKMGLRVFTLLSAEWAWAYIAENNKSSLGPALDKHI